MKIFLFCLVVMLCGCHSTTSTCPAATVVNYEHQYFVECLNIANTGLNAKITDDTI